MKKLLLAALVFCLAVNISSAQKGNTKKTTVNNSAKAEWKTTTSGIKYIYYRKKNGITPHVGDVDLVHFIVMTEKDSVLQSTCDVTSQSSGEPIPVEIRQPQNPGDMMESFMLFGEGDSGSVMIKSDDVFAGENAKNRPPFFPQGSYIKYTLMPKKIEPKEMFLKKMKESEKVIAKQEETMIKDFITKNNFVVKTTENGTFYTTEKEGTGDLPKKGQTVHVLYTGKLLNGKVFDATSNRGNQPFTFKIGEGQVIKGWDEGMMMYKKGGKGKLIIPSRNGYGQQGAGADIPGNAPLLFEVEIVDITD